MLRPSAARCRSFIREPSVPGLEMNRGPVDGARLWGPVVSPLLHAEAGICYRPGRLPERGWLKGSYNTLANALTPRKLIIWICVCPRVPMYTCASTPAKCLPHLSEWTPLCVFELRLSPGQQRLNWLKWATWHRIKHAAFDHIMRWEGLGVFSLEVRLF